LKQVSITDGDAGLVVRPEVARKQLDAETVTDVQPPPEGVQTTSGTEPTGSGPTTPPPPPKARRYHGSVKLDPTRTGRDASEIADEVIAHLSGLMGSNVKVTLEIEADIPDGAPDQVVRTVTENSRTLKFEVSGFEEE
tara:strand:- start:82 stop:495 length:414 start_codon:yes stop_codon:yes gene_type:complete